jgi:predicted nucleic acid-binding protein
MNIHLDTSLIVDALTGPRRSHGLLRDAVARGHRLSVSAIVLFEWLRGPRTDLEVARQAQLFPPSDAVPFGPDEAEAAARIYRTIRRARGREADIAIAACALEHRAVLWTLNPTDFSDIPGLALYPPDSVPGV